MDWKALLAYITGSVDQELLLRNEYLVTENRILRNQIKGRVRLSNGERKTLADIGKRLGKQALAEVASIVTLDTILAWHRKLVAQKFDASQQRKALGRPKVDPELEAFVVRMAQENRSRGYDRIVGALQHLGHTISDQTVGNILKRHGIPPAPERKKTTTWREFIRTHMDVLVATDFFTAGPPVSQQARWRVRVRQWRDAVRQVAAQAWPMGELPVTGLIMLSITYFYESIAMDIDNLPKPILDALRGLVYLDDEQITDVVCRKRNLHSTFRVANPSSVLADGLSSGHEFLYIVVTEAPDQEVIT